MRRAWIALVAAPPLASLASGLLRRGRPARRRQRATIVGLCDSTALDMSTGAVCSVQKADLLIDDEALAEIWNPTHLERLARTYWRFLTRVTLGLIRVRYGERERSVVFLLPVLKLLSFKAPEYEMDATRGLVRWRIERGLLVSRRGRDGLGHLQIEVRRGPAADVRRECLHVEVEVANFYPSIASRLGARLYNATQSRIHVIVTYGFLRSLTRLDLAQSRIGRYDVPTG